MSFFDVHGVFFGRLCSSSIHFGGAWSRGRCRYPLRLLRGLQLLPHILELRLQAMLLLLQPVLLLLHQRRACLRSRRAGCARDGEENMGGCECSFMFVLVKGLFALETRVLLYGFRVIPLPHRPALLLRRLHFIPSIS